VTLNSLDPRRLKDTEGASRGVDARVGRQFRMLSSQLALPRLSQRTRPRLRFLTALRLAMAGAVLVTVGGAASATVAYLVRHWHAPAPQVTAPAPVVVARQAGARVRGRSTAAAQRAGNEDLAGDSVAGALEQPAGKSVPPLAVDPPPVVTQLRSQGGASSRPRPTSAVQPSHSLAVPDEGVSVAVPATAIAEEAALLRRALEALRAGQGRRALDALDAYDARFPRGVLGLEASTARAQSLLRVGDKAAALALLDRLPLTEGGQATELRLVRGELRSLGGRCAEALADFESALVAGRQPDDRARALYGRASCRARTGDEAGAQQDRQRYLREFPGGPAVNRLRRQP
jgi:hypothetical protein